MSADTSMPKGITRGYGEAFRQMVSEVAARALSIKDLENLDDLECYQKITRAELDLRVESDHEPPRVP